jgi:hypothetical protein
MQRDAITVAAAPPGALGRLRRIDRVVLAFVAGLAALAVIVPAQTLDSLVFVGRALSSMAPWFVLSVMLAAASKATGADGQIARVFQGRERRMIVVAALFGALSPFCSCGVIPVIAGLLAAGVPVAPVMAFWLASPLMDPNMFVLTAANLGLEFAVAKSAAAAGIGLLGGFATLLADRLGVIDGALRLETKLSGCARKKTLTPPPPVWRFWQDPVRAQTFVTESGKTAWFLGRWLAVAFLVESLMIAYVPADLIARYLGGDGLLAIPAAVALGIPAYLNGYAAIPLVRGLIELGMSPAVGLAFMLAGGVSSIPAALAVWALVRPRLFAAYLGLAAIGSLAAAYSYAVWMAAS